MTMEKQREFITETLRRVASEVGVDIDKSKGGLLYIAEYQENVDVSDFGPNTEEYIKEAARLWDAHGVFGPNTEEYSKEAARLWDAHGSSLEGRKMLQAVGMACMVANDGTFLTRTWELAPDGKSIDVDWRGWDGDDERSLADYTFLVGYAVRCCDQYFFLKCGGPAGEWFASIGRVGADVRHAPMRELRRWTVERYTQGRYPSALAASHELRDEVLDHGRKIGASLSPYNAQRTIYGWLLAANKALPAGG